MMTFLDIVNTGEKLNSPVKEQGYISKYNCNKLKKCVILLLLDTYGAKHSEGN